MKLLRHGSEESGEPLSADIVRIATVTGVGVFIGAAALLFQHVAVASAALLFAFACLLGGGLIGFLFGIPRVLQGGDASLAEAGREPAATGGVEAPAKPGGARYRQQVNTNLEQISDWLTKIIVGFGLIELRRVPTVLQQLAANVAGGIAIRPCATASCDSARTLALSTTIYFVLLGFLSGYLLTRLYLAVAFRRADEVSLLGQRTNLPKATELLSNVVSDLMGRVNELGSKAAAVLQEPADAIVDEAPASIKAPTRSVLWVDDTPINNQFVVDQLERAGITVTRATSTTEALQLIGARSFDWIVTDMHRIEGGKEHFTAGLELIRALKKQGVATPILVHCGRNSKAKYGYEAKSAGALDVTDSPSEVLSLLTSK